MHSSGISAYAFLMQQVIVTIKPGTKRHLLSASPSPDEQWYINDHTFIYGPDDRWHVFGIWHQEPAAPLDETMFLHASAASLETEWTIHPAVMHARTELGETHVWAPHVIAVDGTYYMFYCGGTTDHAAYRISLATSTDLFTWTHQTPDPLFIDGFDARDPMVIRACGQWIMYYTRTSHPDGGTHQVAARVSNDLHTWSEPVVAFDSGVEGTVGGPTESPFVVEIAEGIFLLFVCESGEYDRTLAYVSTDPLAFSATNHIETDLDEHCAEIIQTPHGSWISGGGWGRGGLSLRPLTFSVTRK